MALVFDGKEQGGEHPTTNGVVNGSDNLSVSKSRQEIEEKFQFELEILYKMAVSFYRG